MGIKQKSDRDAVRQIITAGGWEVAWGDVITEITVITGVLSGPAAPVWAAQQLEAQKRKFGKSLNDIAPAVRDRAIQKVQEIVHNALRGEWNISGIGIKAGLATYHRHFKLPIGGWQNLPNNYQPYIGILIASAPASLVAGHDAMEITMVPNSLAESGPTQAPLEPPPSPIGTWEDISLRMTDEELSSALAMEEQMSLPVAAH